MIWTGMAAASLWAVLAGAQPPPGVHGRPFVDDGAMRAIGAILHVDGLSDEQREQLHGTMESGRSTVEPLLEQLHAANQTLADRLLATNAPSPEALNASLDRVAALRKQLAQQQFQTVVALREVLSQDQLQQAAQHAEQFGAGRDFEKR
jgi:hypothetical protein